MARSPDQVNLRDSGRSCLDASVDFRLRVHFAAGRHGSRDDQVRLTRNMLDFPGSTYEPNDQFEIEIDNEKIVLLRIIDAVPTATHEPESSEGR